MPNYSIPDQSQFNAPVKPVEPTYVPGVGNLGIDIGGYAKGDMMAQDKLLKAAENLRAEKDTVIKQENLDINKDYLKIAQEDLGIRKADSAMRQEEFGWKRADRQKQMMIEDGMSEAAKSGGYTGVIDYLKTVDPAMAIQFHSKKLALDDQMLNSEAAQMAAPNEKTKVLMEGYGLLGKMGQAILKAPEEDRQAMYEQMLPMARQIVPDLPDDVNKASGTFMLAVSQATPENQLFLNTQGLQKAQSQLGKLYSDYERAKLSGNQEAIDTLSSQIRNYQNQADKSQAQLDSLQLGQANTKFQANTKVGNDLQKYSKDYMNTASTYSNTIQPLLKQLEVDPKAGFAQAGLRYKLARFMQGGGVLNDQDYAKMAGAAGYRAYSKKVQAFLSGEVTELDPKEIAEMKAVSEQIINSATAFQQNREKQYGQTIMSRPENQGLVDWKSIPKPSEMYGNQVPSQYPKPTPIAIEEAMKNPSLRPQFESQFGPLDQFVQQQ